MPPVPTFSSTRNCPPRISRPINGSFGRIREPMLPNPEPEREPGPRPDRATDLRGLGTNGLVAAEFLASELFLELGFRHAFFTRRGGVSEGPYESLNFSRAVGDTPERVAQNVGL